jgi:hypothetical protein
VIDSFSKLYDKHPFLMGAAEMASGALLAFGGSSNKLLPKSNTTALKDLHMPNE